MNEPEKYLTPEKMNEVRQRNRSLRRQFLKYNIKNYLLSALFNAPTTMGSFYQSEYRHDMASRVV